MQLASYSHYYSVSQEHIDLTRAVSSPATCEQGTFPHPQIPMRKHGHWPLPGVRNCFLPLWSPLSDSLLARGGAVPT